MTEFTSVEAGLQDVRTRIAKATLLAKRDADSVHLIAVSKGQSADKIRQAFAAGQRDFGESYVQELQRKFTELQDLEDLRWHFIGHLQSNKARHAVKVCQVIHTVDSADLAAELAKRIMPLGVPPLATLVAVNIGKEAQKHGVLASALEPVLQAVEAQPELKLVGLMTIPPNTEDARQSLPFFEELRDLRNKHGGCSRLPELSMGMSDDLQFAIAAGATMVRVGTAIFGPRGQD